MNTPKPIWIQLNYKKIARQKWESADDVRRRSDVRIFVEEYKKKNSSFLNTSQSSGISTFFAKSASDKLRSRMLIFFGGLFYHQQPCEGEKLVGSLLSRWGRAVNGGVVGYNIARIIEKDGRNKSGAWKLVKESRRQARNFKNKSSEWKLCGVYGAPCMDKNR